MADDMETPTPLPIPGPEASTETVPSAPATVEAAQPVESVPAEAAPPPRLDLDAGVLPAPAPVSPAEPTPSLPPILPDTVEFDTDTPRNRTALQTALEHFGRVAREEVEEVYYAIEGVSPLAAASAPEAPPAIQFLYKEQGELPQGYFYDPGTDRVRVKTEEVQENMLASFGRILGAGAIDDLVVVLGRGARAIERSMASEQSLDATADAAKPEGAIEAALDALSPYERASTVLTQNALNSKLGEMGLVVDLKPKVGQQATSAGEDLSQTLPPPGTAPAGFTRSDVRKMRQIAGMIRDGEITALEAGRNAIMNIDYSAATSTTGHLKFIEQVAGIMESQFKAAKGPSRTFSEISEMAGILGTTPARLRARATELAKGVQNADVTIVASKMYLQGLTQHVLQLSRQADMNPSDKAAEAAMVKASNLWLDLAVQVGGASSGIGRALNAHKVIAGIGGDVTRAFSRDELAGMSKTKDLTPEQARGMARRLRLANGDPQATAAALTRSVGTRMIDAHNELYINALLSGTKTAMVNFASTAVQTFVAAPLDRFLGGTAQLMLSGDPNAVIEAKDVMTGLFWSFKDSLRMAGRALKIEDAVLDTAVRTYDAPLKRISADAFALDGSGYAGRIVNGFGKFVRIPSRVLIAQDELFKQMNYRAMVRAQALREGRAGGLDGPGLQAYVYDALGAAFDGTGRGVNEAAMDFARENTFTRDLDVPVWFGRTSFGKGMEKWVQDVPLLRVLTPFVRTPVNLYRQALYRTPGLGMLSRQMAEDMKAGGGRRASAIGKQMTGTALYGGAAWLVLGGQLTGGGPKDPALRQTWLDAGNRPYSVKIGDTWVEYRRMDPASTVVGMTADLLEQAPVTGEVMRVNLPTDTAETLALIADHVQNSGGLSTKEYEEGAGAILHALGKNVTSKTYLSTLTEFIEAFMGGYGGTADDFIRRWSSSYVPNILNQLNPDPIYREARTIIEAYESKLPWASPALPPAVNIFGEPVMKPPGTFNRAFNPMVALKDVEAPVAEELLSLGRGLTMPTQEVVGGQLDLADPKWALEGERDTPYDWAIRTVFGPEYKRRVTRMVSSPGWASLSGGTADYPGGEKLARLQKVKRQVWDRTKNAIRRRYPDLDLAWRRFEVEANAARTGGESALQRARDRMRRMEARENPLNQLFQQQQQQIR